jgi:hypothetical protein
MIWNVFMLKPAQFTGQCAAKQLSFAIAKGCGRSVAPARRRPGFCANKREALCNIRLAGGGNCGQHGPAPCARPLRRDEKPQDVIGYLGLIPGNGTINMKQKMQKRSPSAHQKQMRFFMYLFIVLFLAAFTLAFYFLAKWASTPHGR